MMAKVSLKPIDRADIYQLLEWRNHPDNRKYFREYRLLTEENQDLWYDSLLENDHVMMFAIHKDDDLVGVCGLTSIDWIARSAEVSIYIGDGYIDDEIAPRAFIHLMTYATGTLGLRRLWAEIWDFDVEKRCLLENEQFNLEVTRRQAHWDDGWSDALIYGKVLQDDFMG